jgi:hypothetical protein
VALVLISAAPAAASCVTLRSLLAEMIDRDRIASWPSPAYVSHQASSYDRRSKTPADPEGWFANNDWSQFIRSEVNAGRREWVMMDADGPGCVTRIWWGGTMPPRNRRVRFYLDGSSTPAIEEEAYDLLVGPALAPRPLAIENACGAPGSPGGMNLFLPIPYAKHCKITWDDVNPHDPAAPPENRWYNIEYRTYAPGIQVETFTHKALDAAQPLIDRVCLTLMRPKPETGLSPPLTMVDQVIAPHQEAGRAIETGPMAIREIEAHVAVARPEDLAQALRSTILRIEFDGEETVWCPIGDFFGSGVGLNPLNSWNRTVRPNGDMRCRWTMPLRKAVHVSVMNLGPVSVTVRLDVHTGSWRWDRRSMHFHATWREQNPMPTRPRSDWNYLEATGQGVYAGDTLCVYNPVPDWWGEGDEKVWVDGESFPSHFGTGSEDHYGYSYGDIHLFQGPFSNQVRCDGPGNKGNTVVTRTRDLDAIPFTRSLKYDMEIWHWADCSVIYAVTSYWYALPGATTNRRPMPEEAARPIPGPLRIANAIECESMQIADRAPGVTTDVQTGGCNGEWSGNSQILVRANHPGEFIVLKGRCAPGRRRLTLYATRSWDYGIVEFSVNGQPALTTLDGWSEHAVATGPIDLGVFDIPNGEVVLRVEVIGANPATRGTKSYFGLDCISVTEP